MNRFGACIAAILALSTGVLFAAPAAAGSWQTNAPFGASLQGDLYSPTTPATSPAVLVAIHYCTGSKSKAHGWFDSYADKNGFYIIAPDAGKQCFDSSATRGGDRDAIVKMVQYVISNKNADKGRVFAAGFSSGGCMTNTLLAIYPDVFAGGAAMPGFPAGGWPAGDTTCTKCGSSPPSTDGKYWGDIARKAFAWNGTYPCSQQWVGGSDEYNFNGWLPAVAAQWQNLASLDSGSTGSGAPSGWNRTVYKDAAGNVRLETNIKPGQQHDLTGSGLAGYVVAFLGLDKPTGACGVTGSGTSGTGGTPGGTGGSLGAGGAGGDRGGGVSGRSGTMDGGRDTRASTGGSNGGVGGLATGGGGEASTGGTRGSGGAPGGDGGRSGGGESTSSGGSGSGATNASGGAEGSGGAHASAGSESGGGATSGGSSASEGSGGQPADGGGASGGCTCALGQGRGGAHPSLVLPLLALVMLHRRRRRDR